jgi:RNA polymerase sigma-70 factor (ECF subfamily)
MFGLAVPSTATGDGPAGQPLAEAYRHHADSVRRAAYSVVRDPELADDVTQEVFLALWVRPDRFDPARGTMESLLRVMAKSRALDAARSAQAGQRARDRLAAEPGEPSTSDPADHVATASGARQLRRAVARLPVEQRDSLALAYWGGLTAGQVAALHGVPHGTAKSRMRIGLAKLRRELDH